MSKKVLSTIAGASTVLVVFNLMGKGLGFVREIIFANNFGLENEFDIYLVGAVIPLTINTILLYLGQNYFIPIYNQIKEKNSASLNDFLQTNFYVFIFSGILISIVLYMFSSKIIGLYINSENLNELATAVYIFQIYLLSIPLNCGISILTAQLFVNYEYKFPILSQLILNLTVVIFLMLFSKKFNIYIIPISYIAGSFMQFGYLINKVGWIQFKTNSILSIARGYKNFFPKTLIVIVLIETIGQFYLISDRYFYSRVSKGGIAAMNYAQNLFLLPISIFSIAISTVIFPKLAQSFSKKLFFELENKFNESVKVTFLIFVPATFVLIFYGDIIIKLFFERGKFNGINTLMTYQVLVFYSISLIFYAAYNIFNKMIYSIGLHVKLLVITTMGLVIKVVLNFLLVGNYRQNGLALSTSISYLFFFLASIFLIYKHTSFGDRNVFFPDFIFHLFNGLFSLFLAKNISVLFPGRSYEATFVEMTLFLTIYIINICVMQHSSLLRVKQIFRMIPR